MWNVAAVKDSDGKERLSFQSRDEKTAFRICDSLVEGYFMTFNSFPTLIKAWMALSKWHCS